MTIAEKPQKLKVFIKSRLYQAGFYPVIFTTPKLPRGFSRSYNQWLKTGFIGQMHYLIKHQKIKINPAQQKYKSLIIVGASYAKPALEFKDFKVALYAQSKDYHKLLGQPLKRLVTKLRTKLPQHSWVAGVDATPLAEKGLALAAGFGFLGHNHLIIHPKMGSFIFIGSIITTYNLPPDKINPYPLKPACQNCRACITVCPTRALGGRFFKADRCLSYLTIEHKGPIPIPLRDKLDNWLMGCDLCQLVCPHNFNPQIQTQTNLNKSADFLTGLTLKRVLKIKDRQMFHHIFKGTPFMRAGWENIIRNACYLAGNQKRSDLIPLLKNWTLKGTPTIKEAAAWAITQIGRPH